jgi:hypothetical protein
MRDLQPLKDRKIATGKLSYHESNRAWSVFRLNRIFIEEFPALREKRKEFYYEMMLFYKYASIRKFLETAEKEKRGVPMLLWVKGK